MKKQLLIVCHIPFRFVYEASLPFAHKDRPVVGSSCTVLLQNEVRSPVGLSLQIRYLKSNLRTDTRSTNIICPPTPWNNCERLANFIVYMPKKKSTYMTHRYKIVTITIFDALMVALFISLIENLGFDEIILHNMQHII